MEQNVRTTASAVGMVATIFSLLFAVVIPPFRGADERNQFDLVLQSLTWPGQIQMPVQILPQTLSADDAAGTFDALVPPPITVNSNEAFFDENPFSSLANVAIDLPGNQIAQHPPLYYFATKLATYIPTMLIPETVISWQLSFYLMRLVSALMNGLASVLIFLSALLVITSTWKSVQATQRQILLARAISATVALLVPMRFYIAGTINNDNLALLGGAMIAHAFAIGISRTAHPPPIYFAFGLVVAAGAKATALPTCAIAALGFLALTTRSHAHSNQSYCESFRSLKTHLRTPIGFATFLSIVGVIFYYGSNLVRFSSPFQRPVRLSDGAATLATGNGFESNLLNFFAFVRWWGPFLNRQFWGNDFRSVVEVPNWQAAGLALSLMIFLTASLREQAIGAWLFARVAIHAFLASLVAILVQNFSSFERIGDGTARAVQGRYLWASVPLILVAAAIGINYLCMILGDRFNREWLPVLVPIFVFACSTVITLQFASKILRAQWGSADASLVHKAHLATSAVPVPLFVVTGALTFLTIFVTLRPRR